MTILLITTLLFAAALVPSQALIAPLFALKVGDPFPSSALSKWGVKGKTSVLYFFGADDAPSCKKENSLFSARLSEFGVPVVGVRNAKGAKGADVAQKLVIDEDDEVREEIGIKKDLFGLLGGRETYVVDSKGTVQMVFNDQFKPEKHVELALDAVSELKASSGSSKGGFDIGELLGGLLKK
ncbi:hypothetical protein TeGR_g14292 [Tetraparma gracilis]|uniref:thioredoxin-dependent peroxiredoxin n=1 Tax=Tetraparma gracilis TaxID=2962635 RepID=A0ABQ6MT29_9STRA|nr:hypothetical protein TeGR_g14292 [Tetraparma gracilis]